MATNAFSILHIDSDVAWCKAVEGVIADMPGYKYLGASREARSGLDQCQEMQPDAVVLALRLPDEDGFKVTEAINSMPKRPRQLVLTARSDPFMLHCLDEGRVDGIIWKAPGFEEPLRSALLAAKAGGCFFQDEVLLERAKLRASTTAFFKILSPTEQSLIPLFGIGLLDREIAGQVDMQPSTVKWHRRRIMNRLGLHRSWELIQWARETGFVCFQLPAPPCALSA